MTIKFVIKEAWLLDENGNKSLKLKQLDPNEVFEVADFKSVTGNLGEITEDLTKSN